MAKKASTPKPRNAQDATLRNIRALKARVAKLEEEMESLVAAVNAFMTKPSWMEE